MPQTIHLECPVCQAKQEHIIETAINSQKHPELKQQLLEGQLLAFECDQCGAKRQIETQILYHDPKLKLLIYLAPNFKENREKILKGLSLMTAEEGIDISDYHLRVVTSAPQLIEKIQIFDRGFNDQVMEVVKVLTDGLFAQQEPNRKVLNRFFIHKDNQDKFLYLTEDEQLMVDYHPSLTDFILDKFAKELKNDYLGQFIMVDYEWASNIANHLPGPGQPMLDEE
ncbi:CpXC domain-containing protein [Facklamia sp. P12932]|uniref:CpXC domain-containing protein n=1 Tax=Facklamia sp. P12932 TaxID=3421947 RepID=UPI003D180E3D